MLACGGAGYGDHEYRAIARGNVAPGGLRDLAHTRSLILRGGVEIAATLRAHFRIEFEHLDGSRNQFMRGVPFRF